jgi:RNA polymerase sigma factor (sigma-70 family)
MDSALNRQSLGNHVDLWQRVLANDAAAFEDVVAKYQNLVASVAYSATGNFALSEEIAQETFWQAWRQRTQLRELDRLPAWLCRIARNLAAQVSKREFRQSPLNNYDSDSSRSSSVILADSYESDPLHNAISAEEREIVWKTLEKIPEIYREALVLFYREEQSLAETAAALQISVDLAKQRVHRGRELIRASLANQIEHVLVRTRPSRSLTSRVMLGVVAFGSSLKASSAVCAATVGTTAATTTATGTVGTATVGVAAGTAGSAAKSAALVGSAVVGGLGGLLGAIGGLGGAFLGCWIPSQMAETMAERRLLEKHGRRAFLLAFGFTASVFLGSLLLLLNNGVSWYLGFVGIATVLFTTVVLVLATKSQAQLKQLRSTLPSDAEPNPSLLRRKIGLDKVTYRGRRFTSEWCLLGIPLIDIQFGDVVSPGKSSLEPSQRFPRSPRRAFGWIAIGDRATGFLLAVGGVAKGLIAIGGLAFGGIALGGMAVGGLAVGGCALAWLALGGCAIGYETVGGLAIAWHVATGGGAIAHYLAVGGWAWAKDFAVGGSAFALEANTEAARALAESLSKMRSVDWLARNRFLFLAATLFISMLPAALARFCYRRDN